MEITTYTKDTYDFKTYFDAIKPYLQADLVNEEVPIAGRAYGITGSDFTFNAPEEVADQLSDLGFDVLTFANNHSYDRGFTDIEQTLQALSRAGIKTTGALGKEVKPLNIERNGIRFGIIAYTYDTNRPVDQEVYFVCNARNVWIGDWMILVDNQMRYFMMSSIKLNRS